MLTLPLVDGIERISRHPRVLDKCQILKSICSDLAAHQVLYFLNIVSPVIPPQITRALWRRIWCGNLPSLFLSKLLNVKRSFFSCSFRYLLNSLKSSPPSLFSSPDDTIFCTNTKERISLFASLLEVEPLKQNFVHWQGYSHTTTSHRHHIGCLANSCSCIVTHTGTV